MNWCVVVNLRKTVCQENEACDSRNVLFSKAADKPENKICNSY